MHLMLILLRNVPVIIFPGILLFCLWLDAASLKQRHRYLVSSTGCYSDVMAAVPNVCIIAGSGARSGNVCVSVLAD